MSSFVIDLGEESSYSPAAPKGGNALIIDKKQLATSWYLVLSIWYLGESCGLGPVGLKPTPIEA